jgi:hypothetical protein
MSRQRAYAYNGCFIVVYRPHCCTAQFINISSTGSAMHPRGRSAYYNKPEYITSTSVTWWNNGIETLVIYKLYGLTCTTTMNEDSACKTNSYTRHFDKNIHRVEYRMPITVAARSKAWTVFVRSNTEIIGSNATWRMDVCVHLFCVCAVLCD